MMNSILHTGATVSDIEWQKKFLLETLSMTILSDLPREGDWIDATTGLKGFQSQTVYLTPDERSKIELFHLFRPQLLPVQLTYGAYIGLSHIGLQTSDPVQRIASMSKYRLQLNFIEEDAEEPLLGSGQFRPGLATADQCASACRGHPAIAYPHDRFGSG